ncbi:MAG: isoprenylcysteine carboxylmethyltransferase family protein [Methanosarcinales archaeon]|nr:isoprenylcysteine carboxylmethyltransferase family protein [Methanosarcinales archaeon]
MISGAVAILAYFTFFAAVHSFMDDKVFRRWASRRIGIALDRWHRLAFTLLALIMVLPFLYILAFLPDRILYVASWPAFALMAAIEALAAAMLLIALLQTGVLHFLGLTGPVRPEMVVLVTDGFYCHLRNPFFLFAILFLWSSPIMTASLLTFNIMATIYFYLGARHEERSLKEKFGEAYEEYRQRVPMFLPRIRCRDKRPIDR